MIKTKIVSSLEKAFIDESIDKFTPVERISALRGEKISLQLLYTYEDDGEEFYKVRATPRLEGALAEHVSLYNVENVPVIKPATYGNVDDGFLRTSPGLYPDLLTPLRYNGKIVIMRGATEDALESLWIEIDIPEDCTVAGECALDISLISEIDGSVLAKSSVTVDVIDAALPEQRLIYTQWFYCDCLADYYGVPVWSERHWEIIENYAKTAVKCGINMLLTPVFTPPLDTAVGGERPTTQLVGVKKNSGRYTFSYKLLDRWIDMCNRVGIKYLEISHLFTQWGATHAPKIMATVDGEYKKIFGWETDAHGEEYKKFIRSFLGSFLSHMKKRGDDGRCYFHISDEPNEEQLPDYKKSKKIVEGILKDYVIMDALSSYEFYKRGIVKTPIPSNDHIQKFIDNNAENLWTYYCCGQCVKVSNRLIAMPSWRNRSIGMQMFKYNIVGFLHWGYNFYNNQHSVDAVNPYVDFSGEKWVPAGDTHSVYPTRDGGALPSMRAMVFREALEDMRAMQLCESLYSHEEVVAAIEDTLGYPVAFDKCAGNAAEILAVREKINSMIRAAKGRI